MKKPSNYIAKFCYRHPNFGIPNLMRYVAIANVLLWLLNMVNPLLLSYLAFSPVHIMHGQVWRLVSFVFFPPGSGLLALIAIYFYYWIGSTLEQHWGTGQFTLFFFSGAALTVVFGMLMYFITGSSYGMDAQYIYLSMFLSFATLFPDMQVLLFYVIPIKMKYLAYLDVALFVWGILTGSFPSNLLPVIALVNYLIFCGDMLFAGIRRRPSSTVVNFRKASREIKARERERLYRHKCAVCGKTDTDYPTLEFRYCSRCEGYRCFCEEHIHNHIHFTTSD